MCGRVQLAREIINLLKLHNVQINGETAEALRLVADVIIDKPN
jgi:hypothetical protein